VDLLYASGFLLLDVPPQLSAAPVDPVLAVLLIALASFVLFKWGKSKFQASDFDLERAREIWSSEEETRQEARAEAQLLKERLESYQYDVKPCPHCAELDMVIHDVGPAGKSIRCVCAFCQKVQWAKAKVSNTSGAIEIYESLMMLTVYVDFSFLFKVRSQESSGELAHRASIPESVRREVWRRDQGRCVRCGSQGNLEFNHIIPHSKGGADTARNLQLLCQTCNRSKGASI